MTRHISQTSVARAEQAAKLEKMAVVGSMVNSIVHDFKSPFQMISLGAEMIGRLTADKQIRRISSTITDQVGRMLEMATKLGEYSKGHSQFIYQRESLKTLIDEFISEQSVILEKGKVELSVEVPNIYFDVDSHRFLRAMMNLMSNAVEAMADGRGKIEIRASQTGDNQFELTFEDNGVGIPESIRNCFCGADRTMGQDTRNRPWSAIVKNIIEGHRHDQLRDRDGQGHKIHHGAAHPPARLRALTGSQPTDSQQGGYSFSSRTEILCVRSRLGGGWGASAVLTFAGV
jgi:K+-sensing histidine kinase KdpD